MLAVGFSLVALLVTTTCAASAQPAPAANTTNFDNLPGVVDVLDERGWEDVSFGLMLEQDITSEEADLVRRAHPMTRDLAGGQQTVHLQFNERGDVMLPAGVDHHHLRRGCDATCKTPSRVDYLADVASEEDFGASTGDIPQSRKLPKRVKSKGNSNSWHGKGKSRKTGKKDSSKGDSTSSAAPSTQTGSSGGAGSLLGAAIKTIGDTFTARITWYTGHDLLNPSCVTHSSWTPTDKSLIAAVTIDWPGKPTCGQYLRIRAKDSNKAIVVRVVDSCGGCAALVPHVDLTIAAFSSLYNLNVGLVTGVQIERIDDPVTDYDSQAIATYGPQLL